MNKQNILMKRKVNSRQ